MGCLTASKTTVVQRRHCANFALLISGLLQASGRAWPVHGPLQTMEKRKGPQPFEAHVQSEDERGGEILA